MVWCLCCGKRSLANKCSEDEKDDEDDEEEDEKGVDEETFLLQVTQPSVSPALSSLNSQLSEVTTSITPTGEGRPAGDTGANKLIPLHSVVETHRSHYQKRISINRDGQILQINRRFEDHRVSVCSDDHRHPRDSQVVSNANGSLSTNFDPIFRHDSPINVDLVLDQYVRRSRESWSRQKSMPAKKARFVEEVEVLEIDDSRTPSKSRHSYHISLGGDDSESSSGVGGEEDSWECPKYKRNLLNIRRPSQQSAAEMRRYAEYEWIKQYQAQQNTEYQ